MCLRLLTLDFPCALGASVLHQAEEANAVALQCCGRHASTDGRYSCSLTPIHTIMMAECDCQRTQRRGYIPGAVGALPPPAAASTSAAVIRPAGPEPLTDPRSTCDESH